MPFLVFGLMLASTVLGTASEIQRAFAARKMYEYQARVSEMQARETEQAAKVAKQQAEAEQAQAQIEESQKREEMEQIVGANIAKAGATGQYGGSLFEVNLDIARRAIKDIEIIRYSGEQEYLNKIAERNMLRAQGKNLQAQAGYQRSLGSYEFGMGITSGIVTLLSGVAGAGGFASKAGLFSKGSYFHQPLSPTGTSLETWKYGK